MVPFWISPVEVSKNISGTVFNQMPCTCSSCRRCRIVGSLMIFLVDADEG